MELTLQEQLRSIRESMFVESNEQKVENKINNNIKTNDVHSNLIHKEVIRENVSKINYNENVKRESYNDLEWGDVLYVDLKKGTSSVVGSEQGGDFRYAICVQNLIGNRYSPTTIVLFLTSQQTKGRIPTHCEISAGKFGLPKDSIVLAEQIRTLDKRRIIRKVGQVDELTALKIEKAMKISTARKLERKNTLERLPEEFRKHIINQLNLIEGCKNSLELGYKFKGDKSLIDFFEDKIFEEENSLQYYCDNKNIDYDEIYKNYLELIKKEKENIAL